MLRVFSCLTGQHDLRLVLLAGAVCLLASLVTVRSFHRARATEARARMTWLSLAGAAAGCGIWATHFISILAYEPGLALTFDLQLTALSLAAAMLVTFVGLAFAVNHGTAWAPAAGGAVVGGGVAVMHYTGMWAIELPGRLAWQADLVVASVLLAMLLAGAALAIATRRQNALATVAAAGLLTLSIVGHHFTAMGVVEIIADPTRTATPFSLDTTALAIAVAATAMAILGMTLVAAIADGRLANLTRQFARDRMRLIKASEEKLRHQHLRLDTAINNMGQGLVMFDKDMRLTVCNRRYLEMYRHAAGSGGIAMHDPRCHPAAFR